MKKLFTILCCCLLMSNLFAQNIYHKYDSRHTTNQHINQIEAMILNQKNYQQLMSRFYTNDHYQLNEFTFDNDGKLTAVYDEITNEYKLYDSIRYNAASQIVRLEGFQWLNNIWKNVYYVEYTYNAAGKITSRTNYNMFDGEWTLGGIYEYFYNDNNQIVRTELTMANTLFQTIDYTYENGLLKDEIWGYLDFGTGDIEPSEKFSYEYVNGKVSTIMDSVYDYGWYYDGREENEYDANGNCILRQIFDQNNDVIEKSIYEYNTSLLANTLVPVHPEIIRPRYFTNTNNVVKEQWYALDVEHVLQYVCDYIYEYDATTSVEEHQNAQDLVCYPNPANNMITVTGVENAVVALYDLNGRVVYQGTINGGNNQINVSNLAEGSYILQANENGKMHTTRIVVAR